MGGAMSGEGGARMHGAGQRVGMVVCNGRFCTGMVWAVGGARAALNPHPHAQAGDTAVGWALGYMLNLTNMIPAESPKLRKGIDANCWVVLLLLFGAMVLAALVLLLLRARSKSPSVI